MTLCALCVMVKQQVGTGKETEAFACAPSGAQAFWRYLAHDSVAHGTCRGERYRNEKSQVVLEGCCVAQVRQWHQASIGASRHAPAVGRAANRHEPDVRAAWAVVPEATDVAECSPVASDVVEFPAG